MISTGVDGFKQVREILDQVVRERGRRMIAEGAIDRGARIGIDLE